MEPRFVGNLKSSFGLVGNFFDAQIGPAIAEVADDPASKQVRDALAAVLVGEMDVLIAHRAHRDSLRMAGCKATFCCWRLLTTSARQFENLR